MSTRAQQYAARVTAREQLSEHLVRLRLAVDGFTSTGIPDEWVGLIVPGQFQSRYYTVRTWDGAEMVLDVVVHEVGLVTEWAAREDCVGDDVTITEAKGSFLMPASAEHLLLVGDLTAMPAMARILETHPGVDTRVWADVPDDLGGYLPADVTWVDTDLATAVEAIDWPAGETYFWMAGESAQMRAIRKHLMRERQLPSTAYDVMGYWRGVERRQPRAADPVRSSS